MNVTFFYRCTGNAIWNLMFGSEAGANFDEKSLMISGLIPLLLELNGVHIWVNKDRNSPRSFRPARYGMEVSFFFNDFCPNQSVENGYYFQKENTETVKIEVKRLVDSMKELDGWSHWNESLEVTVKFKSLITMVDSGLVNKACDNFDQHKCRVCRQRVWDVRSKGNAICSDVFFCPFLEISMLEFGGSPTHFVIHMGKFLIDLGNRREFREHSKRGFSELKRVTEKIVHDEILEKLGLHVGEPRAGGAGTSNT